MKKTQILSAIALAFALGVVAPIAVAENASAVTADVKAAAEKDIENAKKSFGTVTLKSGEKVDGYAEYTKADGYIDAATGVVATAQEKKANKAGSAAATLLDAVQTAVSGARDAGITFSEATDKALVDTAFTKGDLAAVSAVAQTVKTELHTKYEVSEKSDAAKTAIKAIEDGEAAAQTVVDAAVAAAVAAGTYADLISEIEALTGKEVKAPKTVTELNALVKEVTTALPQMARYNAVAKAITALEAGITANNVDDVIAKLVADLNAAVAGTTDGTGTDNGTDNGTDTKAPPTGIAGTAEGTATTVSIVAGLATALTALGAGVVAYRSARRK